MGVAGFHGTPFPQPVICIILTGCTVIYASGADADWFLSELLTRYNIQRVLLTVATCSWYSAASVTLISVRLFAILFLGKDILLCFLTQK